MNFFKKIFNSNKKIITDDLTIPKIYIKETNPEEEWFVFEEKKPPHTLVLGACDTYDCGWCIETVWWDNEKECWRDCNSKRAHLPYTHWRKLPSPPKL